MRKMRLITEPWAESKGDYILCHPDRQWGVYQTILQVLNRCFTAFNITWCYHIPSSNPFHHGSNIYFIYTANSFHTPYSFLIQCPHGRKPACCASASEVKKTLFSLINLLPEAQDKVPYILSLRLPPKRIILFLSFILKSASDISAWRIIENLRCNACNYLIMSIIDDFNLAILDSSYYLIYAVNIHINMFVVYNICVYFHKNFEPNFTFNCFSNTVR